MHTALAEEHNSGCPIFSACAFALLMTHGSWEMSFRLIRLRGSRCSIRVISAPAFGVDMWRKWLHASGFHVLECVAQAVWMLGILQNKRKAKANGVELGHQRTRVAQEEPNLEPATSYGQPHPLQTKRIPIEFSVFLSIKPTDLNEQVSANIADLQFFHGTFQIN